MGDTVNAMRDYQAAIRLEPDYSLAYYNAANLYFKQRQFQQVNTASCNVQKNLISFSRTIHIIKPWKPRNESLNGMENSGIFKTMKR